jgi:creatinine amidohydrolase
VAAAVFLENLTWVEAESALNPNTIVVFPLGAAAKEHGPHLKLKNDWTIAEHLKQAVAAKAKNVVIAPTINFFFYPSFSEYPGSITLSQETALFFMTDLVHSLAKFGPHRFYVINTGISTRKPLSAAAEELAHHGITLRFTDFEQSIAPAVREVSEQEGGSHADEIETSIMLHIAPQDVEMKKAVKDFDKSASGRLTREPQKGLCHSPSGVWGDATLATAEKGARVVQSLIDSILNDLEELEKTAPPDAIE